MNKRIRKKVLKRAYEKVEKGEKLSNLELRVYTKACKGFVRRLPGAIERIQEAIKTVFQELAKATGSIFEVSEKEHSFIKRIAIETPMSYEESTCLVNHIRMFGNLETAKEIYENEGFLALVVYKNMLGHQAKIKGGVKNDNRKYCGNPLLGDIHHQKRN